MYSKMQSRIGCWRERLQAFDALFGDHDDLAILDVAHEARADDVERAGLGRQDVCAVELAEDQRADAQRIARADQFLIGEHDQRIGPLDLPQRLDEAFDQLGLAAAGRQDGG